MKEPSRFSSYDVIGHTRGRRAPNRGPVVAVELGVVEVAQGAVANVEAWRSVTEALHHLGQTHRDTADLFEQVPAHGQDSALTAGLRHLDH